MPAALRRALNGAFFAAATAALLIVATPASAQIVEGTDATPAVVDAGQETRTIEIVGGGIVRDVDIVLDFAKIDDAAALASCQPLQSGSGTEWND